MSNKQLPGAQSIIQVELLALIEGSKKGGLTQQQVLSKMGLQVSSDEATRALRVLQRDGRVVKRDSKWVAVRHTDFGVGTIQVLERGDATIRSGSSGEVGWFVRRRHRAGSRHGDLVLFRPITKKKGRSSFSGLPEAKVVEVAHTRHRQLVGTLDGEDQRRWLVPFDPKIKTEIEVADADRVLDDQYVVVELTPSRSPSGGTLRARLVEVLGSIDKPGVDVEVVLRHFEIPDAFPEAIMSEAQNFPSDPSPVDFQGREDLRGLTIVTIDGESSRDFDDAISVRPLPGDGYELGVHIADVSAYVDEGTPLDLEAYQRGTSVYFPERAIPMLPEHLSNGLCSLRPLVPRLTLSAFLTISSDGSVTDRRFSESVIRSSQRLTYGEVAKILGQSGPASYDKDVTDLLHNAQQLMLKMMERRRARGSIDFDLPEGDVVLDSEGFTVGVQPGQRNEAHRIIEEFMIAANEAVAAELFGHELPTLYRVHSPPSQDDLESLREVLKGLGIALKGDLDSLHPEVLQKLLLRVKNRPEEAFVSHMVLRSMQRAIYDDVSNGHYALSSRFYTHFTSPIRRYPDLLVHRQLKKTIRGIDKDSGDDLERRLPGIAEHCSSTERRAERSERTLMQWKLVRFLKNRIGEKFEGRITGVQPFGLFVQLNEFFVDGLVPVRSLVDDFYLFDPVRHELVGSKNHRKFRLADPVVVSLTGVDSRHRSLDLKIAPR